MNKSATITISPATKTLLILVGTVVVLCTIAFFILKATLKSGIERRVEEKVYKRTIEQLDKQLKSEHSLQEALEEIIAEQKKANRASEVRDSILAITQAESIRRLRKIENGYAPINNRYRGIDNDSIRRLFAK